MAASLVGIEQGDVVARAVQQTCATGIDERIPGLNVFAVPLASGRSVVVIRVPASHRAPHAVTISTGRPFWKRRGESKGEMNMSEVREVVMRLETMEAKVERFLAVRREFALKHCALPSLLLCLTPLDLRAGLVDTTDDALRNLIVQDTAKRHGGWDGSPCGPNARPTLHGFGWSGHHDARVELFRNGHFELAVPLQDFLEQVGDHQRIDSLPVVEYIVNFLAQLPH